VGIRSVPDGRRMNAERILWYSPNPPPTNPIAVVAAKNTVPPKTLSSDSDV
jgi:hypothetical protein